MNTSMATASIKEGYSVLARVGQSPLYHLGKVAAVVSGGMHASRNTIGDKVFLVSFGRHGQARVDPRTLVGNRSISSNIHLSPLLHYYPCVYMCASVCVRTLYYIDPIARVLDVHGVISLMRFAE